MKLRIVSLAFAVLILGTVALSAAEVSGPYVGVTIPFAFRAGDSVLPAGDYWVRAGVGGRTVVLQAQKGNTIATVFTITNGTQAEGALGKLLFHKYGNAYFLHQVLLPGHYGAQFPRSKAEIEQARMMKPAATEVAAVVTK